MKKYQQLQSIGELKEGDIIRSTLTKTVYTVHGNYGDHVTAARTVDVTNPYEWEVYRDSEDDEFTLEFANEDRAYQIALTGSIELCGEDLLFSCEVKDSDTLMPRTEQSYWPLSKLDAIQGMINPGSQADISPKWDNYGTMRVKGRSIEIDEGMPVKVYLKLEPVK